MPLSPAPLPGMSPLPEPGQRPPDRHALRFGALAALPTLLVLLIAGQLVLPHIIFLVPGLEAQAGSGHIGEGGATFQGFVYPWTRRDSGGGYTTPASLQNMQSEASLFHMNAVIIPVVADQPIRSESAISWHSGDGGNRDTLPDGDYERAITDALKAGLVPILELQMKQQDFALNPGDETPMRIGQAWFDSNARIELESGNGDDSVVNLERNWFNNYTQYAVHYAQMSQRYHLPYFILGDDLANVTWDTPNTSRNAHPDAIDVPPGDPETNCTGRRDCEWRHVVYALRAAHYATLGAHQPSQGGGFSGKLIYAADWSGAQQGATAPEYQKISWWDAVDYIGVNAFFPLTPNRADVSVDDLISAWHGKAGGVSDVYSSLQGISDQFGRPVVFTAAGYESQIGANISPGELPTNDSGAPGRLDDQEQTNDMQALLQTFTGTGWWQGVFWYADEPVTPRTALPGWSVSTAWAGTSLKDSKPAGLYLHQYYKTAPLPCDCR